MDPLQEQGNKFVPANNPNSNSAVCGTLEAPLALLQTNAIPSSLPRDQVSQMTAATGILPGLPRGADLGIQLGPIPLLPFSGFNGSGCFLPSTNSTTACGTAPMTLPIQTPMSLLYPMQLSGRMQSRVGQSILTTVDSHTTTTSGVTGGMILTGHGETYGVLTDTADYHSPHALGQQGQLVRKDTLGNMSMGTGLVADTPTSLGTKGVMRNPGVFTNAAASDTDGAMGTLVPTNTTAKPPLPPVSSASLTFNSVKSKLSPCQPVPSEDVSSKAADTKTIPRNASETSNAGLKHPKNECGSLSSTLELSRVTSGTSQPLGTLIDDAEDVPYGSMRIFRYNRPPFPHSLFSFYKEKYPRPKKSKWKADSRKVKYETVPISEFLPSSVSAESVSKSMMESAGAAWAPKRAKKQQDKKNKSPARSRKGKGRRGTKAEKAHNSVNSTAAGNPLCVQKPTICKVEHIESASPNMCPGLTSNSSSGETSSREEMKDGKQSPPLIFKEESTGNVRSGESEEAESTPKSPQSKKCVAKDKRGSSVANAVDNTATKKRRKAETKAFVEAVPLRQPPRRARNPQSQLNVIFEKIVSILQQKCPRKLSEAFRPSSGLDPGGDQTPYISLGTVRDKCANATYRSRDELFSELREIAPMAAKEFGEGSVEATKAKAIPALAAGAMVADAFEISMLESSLEHLPPVTVIEAAFADR